MLFRWKLYFQSCWSQKDISWQTIWKEGKLKYSIYTQCTIEYEQANLENCDPPLGNKFDLEVVQRSPWRSRYGTTRKVLSQGTHMQSINLKALSVIVQKLWPRLKFLWQTDRQRDRLTDEWDLMSSRFRESGGQKFKWWDEMNLLFNVTINDISVMYVTAHDVQADWRSWI